MLRTIILVMVAVTAFAGNSLLARAALGGGATGVDPLMDAGTFTAIRVVSGAAMLCLLCGMQGRAFLPRRADAAGVLALMVYMAGFSWAYLDLGAARGALILFGVVQVTMVAAGLLGGVRPRLIELGGIGLAMAGLVYLVAGGIGEATVPMAPAALMAAAGVGWGVYTLLGRGAGDPMARTGRNFLGAAPLALLLLLPGAVQWTVEGIVLAVASGALASGAGYAIWYAVLPQLSRIVAGVSQLMVPPVAALGGIVLLAEPFTMRLGVATIIILLGVGLTLMPARAR